MSGLPPVPQEAQQAVPQNNLLFPNNINRNNFPNVDNLRNILYNFNFNRILNIIKNKIDAANLINHNYVRVLNNDLINISQNTINDVKNYLINHGYQIILIEDAAYNSLGFKVEW